MAKDRRQTDTGRTLFNSISANPITRLIPYLDFGTLNCNYYRPQTKLQKGNVFTSVCQEFCPQGGPPGKQTPPSPPPPQQTAAVADDTHPTGMHSCL